jgi:hypothetical protein
VQVQVLSGVSITYFVMYHFEILIYKKLIIGNERRCKFSRKGANVECLDNNLWSNIECSIYNIGRKEGYGCYAKKSRS